MTEHERLTELGTRYMTAARQVMLDDRHKHGELYLGMPTTDTIIAIAQVIATADRQEATHGTRKFENHVLEWSSEQFGYYWEDHDSFSYLLDEYEILEPPAPGDLLHLKELHDHSATGRKIIFQITNVFMQPDGRRHVVASFITRKEGTHD